MLSNQLVNIPPTPSTPIGEPKTPIFGANAWNQVRFRMAHPFGTGTSQVFSVNGHVWQRNPYNASSTKIGNNKLSQWIGSRDNHGSSDHFDLLIERAGGEGALGGDYLYSVFQFLQVNQGAGVSSGSMAGSCRRRSLLLLPARSPLRNQVISPCLRRPARMV